MSRYYDLIVTDPTTNKVVKEWTSHPGGIFDPSAQNIMFDLPITTYDTPVGGQTITIEGIDLNDLQQAKEYSFLNFTLKAGFQKGLPLANPKQAGLIASGIIIQSFANWIGTEMNLNFVVYPGNYTIDTPGNIVLNWTAGMPLSQAITQCLQTAYPGVTIRVNLSANQVLSHNQIGYYSTLNQLATDISNITASQGNQVYISFQNGSINVFDDTYTPVPIQIQFTDLIGQPMWIQPNIMQMMVALRADIQIGSYIVMPKGFQNLPGFITTNGASQPSFYKYRSAFQGTFFVNEMRQLGNFRSADGQQWSSIINCLVTNPQ